MLDRLLRSQTAPAWFFLLLSVAYLATADYDGETVNDVHAAAHAAWNLATNGTFDLSGLDYDQAWTVRVGDAEYSNRFPGVILAGVPFYLLLRPEAPLVAPSAMAAAFATAVGVTGMLIALQRLVPVRWAWAGAAALGAGTGVWSVGADGLFTHGITTMWLGLTAAGLAMSGRWRWLALVGAAGAVVTRPHLAVALLVAAVVLSRRSRSSGAVLATGALLGAAAFLVYGRVLFGEWSLTGAYGAEILSPTRVGEYNPEEHGGPVLWRLENSAMAFVAPRVGLLPAYPALLLFLWAAARRTPRLPTLPLALFAGALTYGFVSVYLTRVSGGYGFWGNRTLIECVVLAWPMAVWVLAHHRGGRLWRALLTLSVSWSVFFHSLGALVTTPVKPDDEESVLFWQVPTAVRDAEPWQLMVVAAMAALAAALTWGCTRRPAADDTSPDVRTGQAGRDVTGDAEAAAADEPADAPEPTGGARARVSGRRERPSMDVSPHEAREPVGDSAASRPAP